MHEHIHRQVGQPHDDARTFLEANWPQTNQEFFGWAKPERWRKDYTTLRAEVEGQTVGVALYWQMGGVGYLSQLLVASQFRGQGFGRQLLAAFEADCLHCHKLALKTYKDSASQRFYALRGWQVEAVLTNDVHGIDWVYMCKEAGHKEGPEPATSGQA